MVHPSTTRSPGLADVTATLSYQQLISSGTGMALAPSGLLHTATK